MTLYDIHLILPEATEFDNMPQALQDQLIALNAKWPSFPGIGTKSDDGKKLIHARVAHPALSKAVLEGLFAAFGLSWVVAGIREARETQGTYDNEGVVTQEAYYLVIEAIDKATILPYLEDTIISGDEAGDVISKAVALEDAVVLAMYSGTKDLIVN